MQHNESPVTQDLVLIGGGHSHLFVLRHLAMHAPPGLRVTLVTRDLHTPYSGMLPGFVAGHYRHEQAHIDLQPLARRAGIRVIHAEVRAIDTAAGQVLIDGRPPLDYDLLSINIGSRPATPPGALDSGQLAVKPVDRFIRDWQRLEQDLAAIEGPLQLAIVGGGAGGVELALSLDYRCRQLAALQDRLRISIVTDQDRLLPGHNARVRRIFEDLLDKRGIEVRYQFTAAGSTADGLRSATGAELEADRVIWVTHASAPEWLRDSGLQLDANGFVAVSPALQSLSHENVFAAGDIAAVVAYPRPKSGVFAVRQGLPLAKNLVRVARGQALRAFKPQRQFLSLISTGERYAVASRGGWALQGRWCWWLKDWIDRRFMRRFGVGGDLPDVAADADKMLPMRCGGCGSKLGRGTLEQVLDRIEAERGVRVDDGFDSVDDAAMLAVEPGKSLIQSVDQFRSFIDDPYLFGKIATHHALGDLFAMGVNPHSAMVIANVAFGSEEKQAQDLYQLMVGVTEVLQQHGTRLLGGHSAEASQMSCGLSVNGFATADELWLKAGLRPGDALILTRPLGSGVLFAADMRGLAQGRWIDAAIEQMLVSNASAAQCLRGFDTSACTDVTGFGLAGHLFELTRASGCAAEIFVDFLPLYAGAVELAEQGIESTLKPQNLRIRHVIADDGGLSSHPHYPLLFDPQTAGGLLAGVAASEAESCLQALQAQGQPSARIIGQAVASDDHEKSIRLRTA